MLAKEPTWLERILDSIYCSWLATCSKALAYFFLYVPRPMPSTSFSANNPTHHMVRPHSGFPNPCLCGRLCSMLGLGPGPTGSFVSRDAGSDCPEPDSLMHRLIGSHLCVRPVALVRPG